MAQPDEFLHPVGLVQMPHCLLMWWAGCCSRRTALLWPEGEMPPSPPEYSQVVAQLVQQPWAVRGQHLPTGGLYLGREGEKPAGSLLQCLTDDVDSHMHRLGGSSCHASTPTSPTGNDVIKDMLLWPRKIWIHRTTRTLDVLNFHCRQSCNPALLSVHWGGAQVPRTQFSSWKLPKGSLPVIWGSTLCWAGLHCPNLCRPK